MEKILFISDYSFYVPGGAQKSMEIIMEGLCEKYEFWVLMPGKQYSPLSKKYKCICLEEFDTFLVNESLFKTLRLLSAMKKVFKTVNPAVIHAHMVSGMSALEIMKILGWLDKYKLVYTERGVADQYSKITRMIISHMVKNFDAVVTTTNYNKMMYQKLYQISENIISVIPNTAGAVFEEFDIQNIKIMKNKYGLKKKTVMMNARLTYNKNWDLSLEILKWLSSIDDFNYIVVVGSDQSEQDKKQCHELLKTIEGIVGNENLLGFCDISLEKLNELYYASDIFIMTSRSESFGRTAVEAMSRYNVVFGTNIDGLAEVIGIDDYKFSDLQEFKDKYNDLKKNRNIEDEKKMFYKRFCKNYSLRNNLELSNDLYQKLTQKGKKFNDNY